MLIDTHCHLDFPQFDADRDSVLRRARKNGVGYIINVGSSMEGTLKSIELSQSQDFIYAAAGIHPHEADSVSEDDIERFSELILRKKLVAVGEIGLDYYKSISSKSSQESLFRKMLSIAKDMGLPVIIHNREAHADTISILKECMGRRVNGVMHCFSGDKEFLEECLACGMYISFTCNVTFKNAERLRALVKAVPVERLLLETDAPFLAPPPFRGRRNEPAYILYLAEEVARIKGISMEELSSVTSRNAMELFSIG